MPPTAQSDYSAITIIVVKPNQQQNAENAAIAADPEGGAGTFVPGTPLRAKDDPSNTVVAYWARWNMKPGQRSVLAQNLGGPVNVFTVGQNIPLNRDRWLFDAVPGQWTPQAVLDVLGLDRLDYGD